MSQVMPPNHSESLPGGAEGMPVLVHYWGIIRHRLKLIGLVFVAAVLIAMGMSLLSPKFYESTTTLLPQLDSEGGPGMAGLLAAAGGVDRAAQNLGISLPGAPATPVDVFLAILKSRVLADEVIAKFNLKELYETKTMSDTRKALAGATVVTLTKEKVVRVVVEDTSPQRAADMANFYVETLDRLNRTLNVSKASHNRQFIENRMLATQAKLAEAEDAVKNFQTEHKAVAMYEQSRAMVDAVSSVQGQLLAQSIQLQVMETYMGPENPEILRVRASIDELRKQLAIFENGDGSIGTGAKGVKGGRKTVLGSKSQPAMVDVPGLAVEYGRLMRELKVHESLYTLLASEYEQAKYQEARNTPTVQILDTAVPAERKSRPITMVNMLVGGVVGIMFGVVLAFWLEHRDRRRTADIHLVSEKAA